jgi:hypothetical protein
MELYKVTHKVYFNERVKQVLFRGKETYPLYVQVIYNRSNIIFKSYYFDVFAQPKYDYLGLTIPQIEALEKQIFDFVFNLLTDKNAAGFDLPDFSRAYKMFSADIMDSLDDPFKSFLTDFFRQEGLEGHSMMVEQSTGDVSVIQLLDEFKETLQPALYQRILEKAIDKAPPYIPLAAYIRQQNPDGPFFLPVYQWADLNYQSAFEGYMDLEYQRYDMGKVLKIIKARLFPQGYGFTPYP